MAVKVCILQMVDRNNFIGVLRDDGRKSGRIILHNAHMIRKWGSDEGLGDLVQGPKSGTILSKRYNSGGECVLQYCNLVFVLQVNAKAWATALELKEV